MSGRAKGASNPPMKSKLPIQRQDALAEKPITAGLILWQFVLAMLIVGLVIGATRML